MILENASGFIYLVSSMGVTGTRQKLSEGLRDTVERTVKCSNGTPVAVGFGISGPGQVAEVIGMGAEGAIVGSAIVDMASKGRGVEELLKLVDSLKKGARVMAKPSLTVYPTGEKS